MNDQTIPLEYAPRIARSNRWRFLILFGIITCLGTVALVVGRTRVIHEVAICRECGAIKEKKSVVTGRGVLFVNESAPQSASRRAWNETVDKTGNCCLHDWQWSLDKDGVDLLAKMRASQRQMRMNFEQNRYSTKKFEDEQRRIQDEIKRETDKYYRNRGTP